MGDGLRASVVEGSRTVVPIPFGVWVSIILGSGEGLGVGVVEQHLWNMVTSVVVMSLNSGRFSGSAAQHHSTRGTTSSGHSSTLGLMFCNQHIIVNSLMKIILIVIMIKINRQRKKNT